MDLSLKFALLFGPIVAFGSFICLGWWAMKLETNFSYLGLFIVSLVLGIAEFLLCLFAPDLWRGISIAVFAGFVLLTCLALTITEKLK